MYLESFLENNDMLCFQTDRPSSQYWNSGMVRGHKELSQDFKVSITHISEQSCHNKVRPISFKIFNMIEIICDRIGLMESSRL